ncbi:MAG: glycosyltransferase [Dysgonamonadaceae bacterium]|jgi:hypothetical protein|nr:glycosyltransferase [Dysgonamonadaceae bacterium]
MDKKFLAPICLFVYNRLELTKQTVAALQKNFLASESELFVFSDGAKTENASEKVNQVREYVKTIDGFKTVKIFESKENKGLATSIISGVTQILEKYGKAIVLEDDLVTSPNFLDFMNAALDYYEHNYTVFSIAGYTPPIKNADSDVYFTQRASSWGWATWNDRWDKIDWNVSDYEQFSRNGKLKKQFNRMGTDMCKMLNDQMKGKINSWAIRWCFHQFKNNLFSVFPANSKIINIGTGNDASNTKDRFNRFYTTLDTTDCRNFIFSDKIVLEKKYLKQFLKQYSICTRIKYKILNSITINSK